jgi:hemolysin III
MDALTVKPKLRGVIHQIAFFVSVFTGAALIALASAGARLGATIYSISLSSLLGTSALYHRVNWTPRVRAWMRKLDHSMIFLLIAGTFTPIAIAVSHVHWIRYLLLIVWGGAILGICLHVLPIRGPKALIVVPYLALGWLGVTLMPIAWRELGPTTPLLLAAGGILYTLGATAYARRSPNPSPEFFGYHEVFHAFVAAAAALHYAAVALVVAR